MEISMKKTITNLIELGELPEDTRIEDDMILTYLSESSMELSLVENPYSRINPGLVGLAGIILKIKFPFLEQKITPELWEGLIKGFVKTLINEIHENNKRQM